MIERREGREVSFSSSPNIGPVDIRLSRGPLFVEFCQKRPDQTDGRVFMGEDPDYVFSSLDPFIQLSQEVRASTPNTILSGKGFSILFTLSCQSPKRLPHLSSIPIEWDLLTVFSRP